MSETFVERVIRERGGQVRSNNLTVEPAIQGPLTIMKGASWVGNKAIHILENPTRAEFMAFMKQHGPNLKGLYDPFTRTKYVWNPYQALHDDVAKQFGVRDPVRLSALKSYDDLDWVGK